MLENSFILFQTQKRSFKKAKSGHQVLKIFILVQK